MKAAIYRQYGSAEQVKVEEIPAPIIKDDELFVDMISSSLNSADLRIRSMNPPKGFKFIMRLAMGFNTPRQPILGMDGVGIIQKTGKKADQFKEGDIIAFAKDFECHAEFVKLKSKDAIVKISADHDPKEINSLIFGGITALSFLDEKIHLKKDDHILINGASGSVGLAAVQIAKIMGAKVSAVASRKNHKTLLDMGADECIDYNKQDLYQLDQKYDVIMDCVGNLVFQKSRKILSNKGHFLMVVASLGAQLQAFIGNLFSSQKRVGGIAIATSEKLQKLISYFENGQLKPVIEKVYKLDEIEQAHIHGDTGRKVGSIIIDIKNPRNK